MAKIEEQTLLEEWREPTGSRPVKRGAKEYYQYVYEPGESRLVNSNLICRDCAFRGNCYRGRHAMVGACDEKRV